MINNDANIMVNSEWDRRKLIHQFWEDIIKDGS